MTGMRITSHVVAIGLLCVPVIAGAQPLVPDCNGPTCGFGDFMQLIINIINFLLAIAIPIFSIVFVWSGFLMVTAGAKVAQREQAKGRMTKAFVGFIFACGAFLLVKFVVVIFLGKESRQDVEQFINL